MQSKSILKSKLKTYCFIVVNLLNTSHYFDNYRATELFVELMTREAYDVMDESYKVII